MPSYSNANFNSEQYPSSSRLDPVMFFKKSGRIVGNKYPLKIDSNAILVARSPLE